MSILNVTLLVLGALSIIWLAAYQNATMLDGGAAFHVAADLRDHRRARYYFISMWMGISAGFVSIVGASALSTVAFDNGSERDLLLAGLHALGIWGIVVAALVWTQVGRRATHPAPEDGEPRLAGHRHDDPETRPDLRIDRR